MIDFNRPPFFGTELEYVKEAAAVNRKICGDGPFTMKCQEWMEESFKAKKVLLTTSGTSALEMAALLCELQPGDEVILPSYTFSTTATAFVLAGAKLVFVDIRPDTMNIDEKVIEAAITDMTRVIVAVHYAGVACEMDTILDIAKRYSLLVVEDAAQAVMSTYKGKPLGTIGDFGCFSFHETKNFSMGEGGALCINNEKYCDRAEVIREKGTNRSRFFRGQVDKYTWIDYGSSYLPSDMNAAYLWGQLEHADEMTNNRLSVWNAYHQAFKKFEDQGKVVLPFVPEECIHNAHMYYLVFESLEKRTDFINFLRQRNVMACFHYIPLHSAPAGEKFGRFNGEDVFTSRISDRLVRLPLYFDLSEEDLSTVIAAVSEYFTEQ